LQDALTIKEAKFQILTAPLHFLTDISQNLEEGWSKVSKQNLTKQKLICKFGDEGNAEEPAPEPTEVLADGTVSRKNTIYSDARRGTVLAGASARPAAGALLQPQSMPTVVEGGEEEEEDNEEEKEEETEQKRPGEVQDDITDESQAPPPTALQAQLIAFAQAQPPEPEQEATDTNVVVSEQQSHPGSIPPETFEQQTDSKVVLHDPNSRLLELLLKFAKHVENPSYPALFTDTDKQVRTCSHPVAANNFVSC
jgi:hypothetical protein